MNLVRLFVLGTAAVLVACGGSGDAASSAMGADGGASAPTSCTTTAQLTTIVTDVDQQLGRPAVDDQYVYVPGRFPEGIGVKRFPKAGGAGVMLASTALPDGTVPDTAVLAGGDVWFVGSLSGTVYKVPKAGGASTYTTIATGYGLTTQRRMVADADAVYLLGWKGEDGVLDRFPLAGGAPQTLATVAGGQFSLALYGGDVWFSGGKILDLGVYRIPKTGGTPEKTSGEQCLVGFAVTADAIFCGGTNALERIPRAGGPAVTLYATPANSIDGLDSVIFSDDASVAYVNDRTGEPNTKAARVSRVDTATGTTTTLACATMPMKRMALGPDMLAWSGNFVGVTAKEDLQLVPR